MDFYLFSDTNPAECSNRDRIDWKMKDGGRIIFYLVGFFSIIILIYLGVYKFVSVDNQIKNDTKPIIPNLRIATPSNLNIAEKANNNADSNPTVRMKVMSTHGEGEVLIKVHPEWAPLGAERFLELVKDHYFDNNRFFRALKV
jgi:hypothetical protein